MLLAVHRDHLPAMIRECYETTSILVHNILDRSRMFTSSDLHNEKMLLLGKLSAGLAHELNNPASVTLNSLDSGSCHLEEADALFVFIDTRPRSEWLPSGVLCDTKGFILTGRDLITAEGYARIWKERREPLPLETSVPGFRMCPCLSTTGNICSLVGWKQPYQIRCSFCGRCSTNSSCSSVPSDRNTLSVRPLGSWLNARSRSESDRLPHSCIRSVTLVSVCTPSLPRAMDLQNAGTFKKKATQRVPTRVLSGFWLIGLKPAKPLSLPFHAGRGRTSSPLPCRNPRSPSVQLPME